MSSAQGGGGGRDRTTTEDILDVLRVLMVDLDVLLQVCDGCISSVAEWEKAKIVFVLVGVIFKQLAELQLASKKKRLTQSQLQHPAAG